MKLSLLFLSTVLLAPFSEASVALTDRWTIGSVDAVSSSVFEYQGMSKAWLGTDPNLKIRATFYDGGCKVDGTLDLSPWYAATGYNPPAVTPAAPDVTLEGGESAFTDPSFSWDQDNLRLNFATNPRVMTAMGDFGIDGVLVYCVRLGLYAGGISSDEINFQESIVTLNITMDGTFTIDEFGVAPKAQGESDAAQEYSVVASLCTPQAEGTKFNQGAAIKVCIVLDEQATNDQVELQSVDSFTWKRAGTNNQEGIVAGQEASNGLTVMEAFGTTNVEITSVLFAKFYESEGTVTADGSVTMVFPSAGTGTGTAAADEAATEDVATAAEAADEAATAGDEAATADDEAAAVEAAAIEAANADDVLLQLNGMPIDFSSSSDPNVSSSATELTLIDYRHAEIDATTLGNFGNSDFSIEFTFSFNWEEDMFPNGSYGVLFYRSVITQAPYTGPAAFLYDNGTIQFRMRSDDRMFCSGKLPNSGAYMRVLKFEKIGSTLILSIDGVEECTYETTETPDLSHFVDAPLRFGGSRPTYYYLNSQLSNIKLGGVTHRRRRRLDGNNRRLGGSNNNDNSRRHLQDGGAVVAGFEISAELNKADDGPVAIQQTAAAGAGTSITVVATIVGLVSAILLA